MESKGFSIGTTLKKGWFLMKQNLGFYIPFLLIYVIFSGLMGGLPMLFGTEQALVTENVYLYWITYIVLYWILIVLAFGLIRSGLRLASGEKATFADLFSTAGKSITYIISSIIYGLIVLVGTVLFIIPGVMWAAKFSLYPYFILDKGAGPIEALKLSGTATTGFKWDIFFMSIASYVIILLGALCLFVGLFAAVPVSLIAWGFVYRKITASSSPVSRESSTPEREFVSSGRS